MLHRNPVNRWFQPKMFSAGYSPRSWEGWVVTMVGSTLVGWGVGRLLEYVGWGGAG